MANGNGSIDEIIGQEAIKGIDITTQKMEGLYKVFIQNIAVINNLNSTLGDVKGIRDVSKLIDDINKETTKATTTLKTYTQTQAAAAVEQQRLRAQMKGLAKETSDNIGAYERLNAQHKRTEKQAKDVGIQLGLESEQFKKLSLEATKYRDALAKVEQAVGNNSRITGDYRQKLFGVTQVLRELPAFTYSAQTGILGISNNLPILADNFKSVASAVNETTGKVNGTVGALKIFGASIFSFGNIFAIAIGLFTIFSKQIFELFKGTTELTEAQKGYAKSLGDAEGKLRTSIEILNNKNLSHKEHLRVANELKKTYPVTLANYSAEEIAAGKASQSIDGLKVSIVNLARAKAVQSDLDAQAARQYEIEKLRADGLQRIIQLQKAQADQERVVKGQIRGGDREEAQLAILARINSDLRNEKDNVIALTTEYSKINTVISGMAAKISGLTANVTDENVGGSKTPKTPKAKEADLQTETMQQLKIMRLNLQQFNGEISEDTKKAVEKSINELMDLTKANPIKFTWTWADSLEAFAEQAVKELTKIQEIVGEMGEAISTLSSIATDKELARLDEKNKALKEYYDNELRFIEQSGMSTDKKEKEKQKLKAETEAKQKQIDRDRITALRKQASIDKAVNISNIIISTALAISKQLVATPLPAGAVFVASQVALGAAQLAKAIATPLPQYAKGRKGGKAEWAVTNEQGAELHITKDGKAYIPNEGKMGTTFLGEDTTVLPADITKQIMSASYITLAQATQGKTEALQLALLEKTDKEIIELIGLRKDLRAKEMSATFNNYTGFEAWKNIHIR